MGIKPLRLNQLRVIRKDTERKEEVITDRCTE